MANWCINRSKELSDPSELLAYRALSKLDDTWTVVWAYDYLKGNTAHEGDFLILGPAGRLVVLEVKRRDRVFARTGESDGASGGRARDEDQVQAQKDGVLQALIEARKKSPDKLEVPFIVPLLFSASGNSFDKRRPGQPFSVIRGVERLETLPDLWAEITVGGKPASDSEKIRNLFQTVYGDATAGAEAKFLTLTDRLLLDRAAADFSLLDAMSDNRQLLVRGGPGSGKTWMAERHALRLAASGLDVLFLCYNKALGATFQHDIPRLQRKAVKGAPGGGRLTVRTWEALCDEFASDYPGLPSKPAPGATREEMIHYYENKLPGAMYEEVYKDDFKPPFDALIVDEAQDHNTDWWEKLYFPLLRNETSAPMGIYYDGAQRPAFREGSFDLGAIAGKLSQPGHLRLLETRRYTRPIFDFLRALESDETRSLVDGLASNHLLAGPEMLSEEHPHLEAAKSAAAARLKLWFKDKLANPADTLVLTRIDPFGAKSPVFRNCETFAGFTLVPADAPHAFEKGNLRATSFNKAKGLDARAVVLLDTLPWENLPPGERVAFWIAASRARQMLAVFATKQ